MKFERHGKIETNWIDDCLVVKPMGSVNAEGALYFNKVIEDGVISKGLSNWFRLECLCDEDMLGTPEVYKILKDSLDWSKKMAV